MNIFTIQVEDPASQLWQTMPAEAQRLITANALNALLRGELYPTGIDQLELAIALAETGVAPEIISKLTRLDMELFDPFIKNKD
jgi:hypothetical protein